MGDQQTMGFGKFVPGFDFLQNIAKSASQSLPQMPNISSWVAPTMNVEELEKRIGELKAVHFWLEQNGKALGATIQALEVQKMTLATLKGMNVSMGEMANALKLKTPDMLAPTDAASAADVTPAASAKRKTGAGKSAKGSAQSTATANVVDPMQWWGALTQQFQEIATTALKDAATQSAVGAARNMATGMAKGALKGAAGMARTAGAAASRKKSAPAKRGK